eukprot:maker-scaffold9_size846264-snap-gene-3.9 protein:Tk08392 transcript:maker-scaffold9_size846264-snap-gene-3.9-mRNA-1 annotation:"f-box lrr-repeat protein 2-like isoformx1"
MDMVAGAGGIFGQLAVGLAGGMVGEQFIPGHMRMPQKMSTKPTIDSLPDKVLLRIFAYLPHKEVVDNSLVCKKWHMISQDPRLWVFVSLRQDISGLHVNRAETFCKLIPTKFKELKYLEINTELVTPQVFQDLAKHCLYLSHLYLDFSQASQLHDFTDMSIFPTRLKYMCICLSDVIFLDNFMKRIYSFINGLEMLHIVGTYEKAEEEEGEVYEVISVKLLKQATPNLRAISLYGISFLEDSHIELFSSNCIQLQVLNVNYCEKVKGASLKILLQRCKNLKCLLMQQTTLDSQNVMAADWEKATCLQELDITATDLSKECLLDILPRIQAIRWLSAGQLDGFTDTVLKTWMENANLKELVALDLDSSDNLTDDAIQVFIDAYGPQLIGLVLSGMPHVTDTLWLKALPKLHNAKTLVMGANNRMTMKIHVDHLIDAIANHCTKVERVEFGWDNDTLRFSDKNQKAIDLIRTKCSKLQCFVLSDGRLYEIMKGNFLRADRRSVIRTSTACHVTLHNLLLHYQEMLFG